MSNATDTNAMKVNNGVNVDALLGAARRWGRHLRPPSSNGAQIASG